MWNEDKSIKMLFFSFRKYVGKQYGKYVIKNQIGEGRYGMCYLATSSDGTPVIIKRFKPNILKKNKAKNAYEAIILSQLKHDAIPELLGVINQKGFYAYVLEQKQGDTIETMLFKHNHKFTSEDIYSIGIQLIAILKYIHENGFVHRDIRTPNVLLYQGKVSLIDFGLARFADPYKYLYDYDFSYLGDFLLYLLYSSYEAPPKHKKLPWYSELQLNSNQKLFLKKLLRIEPPYDNINDVENDFINFFHKTDPI